MSNFIEDLKEAETEKYWSFPSSYSIERKKRETQSMVYSGEYYGSKKMDGFYYRFIKDFEGNTRLQSRSRGVNGQFSEKIGHLPHLADFFNSLPNGTVLLGEIFMEGHISKDVTTIMGSLAPKAIERQKDPARRLHYYIFDVWAYNGVSYMNTPAEERFKTLKDLSTKFTDEYVEWAEYLQGKELWELYQTVLADGGEGIVITLGSSKPEPGKRTARKTLKLKKELQETLDVIVMGANAPTKEYTGKDPLNWRLWVNTRTGDFYEGLKGYEPDRATEGWIPVTKNFFYNWAGSLKIGVVKGNKIVQIGSLAGMTDEVLENWRQYVGKIAEVTAMEIFKDTGGIRHPRFLRWRDDMATADCTWEKVFG